ncbi:MAG: hypothetical protein IAI49_07785 [Candidatus Eremiobacteraeota bacterium]|nr:hypothetical protein [Candidatus Eremiobacteraeota bacterium]
MTPLGRREPSLEHVSALTDDVGIHQHATFDIANRHEGYCTDDVARAFIVSTVASRSQSRGEEAARLGRVYLSFLLHAQRSDGRFRNFMSYSREWLDDAGTPDSNGRAIWAIGHGLRFSATDSWRRTCAQILERALPHVASLTFVRSQAYAALGLVHAYEGHGRKHPRIETELRAIGTDLIARHASCSAGGWDWFENELTYDNARLPEALLRIGSVLEDSRMVDLGLRTYAFYESVVVENDTLVPIGNDGWYVRGKPRARYAQQPLEAAAFVDASLAAQAATGDSRYRRLAEIGLAWYHGRNSEDAVMVAAGGCYDGLEALGVNRNMGAESTLAYVASAFALAAPALTGAVSLAR